MDLGEFIQEVLMRAIQMSADETFTNLPVRVQSRSGGFVDVVPLVKRPVETAEGAMSYEDYPMVPNVPIAFPQATGGFYLTWDIQPDSVGILVTAKHSLAEWRRDGVVSAPGDHRLHHLGSGWFLPQASADKDAPTIVAGKLVIEAPEILLGKNATDPVGNAVKIKAELDKIVAAFGSAVAPSGGGPVTYGAGYVTSSDVGAAKVKAE